MYKYLKNYHKKLAQYQVPNKVFIFLNPEVDLKLKPVLDFVKNINKYFRAIL